MRGFFSDLAVREHVAASTQNQAFNALLFFYRHVLHREFGQVDGVVRAKHHRYVPVVLSQAETEAVLGELHSLTLKEAKSPLDLDPTLTPDRSQPTV